MPAGSAGARTPSAPWRTATSGRDDPIPPLVTIDSPSAPIGVGVAIGEPLATRQRSLPVRGSYPRAKFPPLTISSAPFAVVTTVGLLHDGMSSRFVFHTCSPVSTDSAIRNESSRVSTWTITRPSQITGELAGPHSIAAASAAPDAHAAEVHFPQRRSLHGVGVESLRSEPGDDDPAVRRGS